MNPLANLQEEINELVESFLSAPVWGTLLCGVTQYTFWMFVACALLLIVMFRFKRKQAADLVPQGRFVNAVEFIIEYVRDDLCQGLLGDAWREHFPFIASVFFFVLANNIVGVIPGKKPGTGTIGTTAALAVCSFVYFVALGIKRKGVGGYIKSLAPEGVAFPINVLVAIIEAFSQVLRPITLAVRLFCNLFAGHIVMGTFAILASLYVQPLLVEASAQTVALAGASIGWILILIIIYAVELLVAVIQAYVFTLLSAVYVQLVENE